METMSKAIPKRAGFLKNSTLVILVFATAFFPRLVETIGAPAPINFLHFATVPFAAALVLTKSRVRDRHQIQIVWQLLVGLLFLLTAIVASAFLNDAGGINAVLAFLLLGEPFILLIALVGLPLSAKSFTSFQTWIRRFCLFHVFLAIAQRYILRFDLKPTGMEPPDNIQGVFFLSGAGHVVGTSVSLSFGIYYFFTAKDVPLYFRALVMLAAFTHMLAADGKQVLLFLGVAWLLLVLIKLKDIAKAIQYVAGGIVFGYGFFWCMQNIEAFASFNTWIRPELYGPEGEATRLKFASLRIIPTYYESVLNGLFGLGPGHTVGRLGGWMLREYAGLLNPLGATSHDASRAVWQAVGESWLGSQSSMFSPLFGWAGIWGDLGFIGLGAYLWLAYVVWHHLCLDDISKLLLLSIFVSGLIFSQMEEPGYMLSIAMLIGLRWQEHRMSHQAQAVIHPDHALASSVVQ
ncbi:MAG: hypothetical protein MUF72_20830 [Elainella sp. Prado103]|jgi:hypothetical protein|nr:hypothetical protein [Elainella sp. Prado103]